MDTKLLLMPNFKNYLIQSKYASEQNKLIETLLNPDYLKCHKTPDTISWIKYNPYLGNDPSIYCNESCSLCVNTRFSYHKFVDLSIINTNDICGNISDLDNIPNFKIKEHIHLKHGYRSNFKIEGKYELYLKDNDMIYIPKNPNLLTLNQIPVKFVHERFNLECNTSLLYFSFDLTLYVHLITGILKCYKCHNCYFNYLPLEILRYILYLITNL